MGFRGRVDQRPGCARILVVDLAPDLTELLRRTFPGAEVHVAGSADVLDRLLLASWDVLVVDLDTVRLGQVLSQVGRLRVVGVTSSPDRARHHGGLADVLLGPVLGEDLRRSIGRLLDGADRGQREDRRLARVRAALPIARILALALGLSVDLAGTGGQGAETVLGILALLASLVRLRPHAANRSTAWTAVDLVLACALLVLTGGPESSYLPFAWVLAADAGLRFPPRGVITVLAALVAATAPGGISIIEAPGGGHAWAAVAVVLGSVAIITALVRRLWRTDPDSATAELREAHAALGTALALSARVPGGLAASEAASALLDEAVRRWGIAAGVVLVDQGGTLVEAGSRGLMPHTPTALPAGDPLARELRDGGTRTVTDTAVPEVLRLAAPSSDPWTATPLRHDGAVVGAVLWMGRQHLNERIRLELRPYAHRGGLAIATARRFEQLRSVANDTDRARVRSALEGDVFQNVLSLRYELELLGMRPDAAGLRPQLDRLSALARDVAADVRVTADRIGSEIDARGLGAAIRDHCRDLRRLTPVRVDVDLRTEHRPDRDAEVVAYELAMTAIHRAVAAPLVTWVAVRLVEREGATVVEVEHDGVPTVADGAEESAAHAAEFGVSVRALDVADRNVVCITAAPIALPADEVAT